MKHIRLAGTRWGVTRLVVGACLILGGHVVGGMVRPAWGAPAAPNATLTAEADPVAALDMALIATMKAGSANTPFMDRYAALDPVVKASLNLPLILQNSVGFLWPTLPASQQDVLQSLFEQFTVASYINGFSGYSGQRIDILPEERDVGTKKIVETQIVSPDGSTPTRLDYVMTDSNDGWQITDVLLNATISKVAVQASDFSALVSSGDASKLIAALKTKITALSGGALGN